MPLGGWFRRALFAARLGTTRLLFSNDITPESRIMLYRPDPNAACQARAFLRFDRDPYLVLSEGRLFWIADAYTALLVFLTLPRARDGATTCEIRSRR